MFTSSQAPTRRCLVTCSHSCRGWFSSCVASRTSPLSLARSRHRRTFPQHVIAIRTIAARCCCWWWGLLSSFIHRRGCRRVSFRCTGDTRISFAAKLPDNVIFDKIMPDQVRLHHVIFLEKFALAAIARSNSALPTQTHTMLFCSGNKISYMMQ